MALFLFLCLASALPHLHALLAPSFDDLFRRRLDLVGSFACPFSTSNGLPAATQLHSLVPGNCAPSLPPTRCIFCRREAGRTTVEACSAAVPWP